jgi:hypothetical protein
MLLNNDVPIPKATSWHREEIDIKRMMALLHITGPETQSKASRETPAHGPDNLESHEPSTSLPERVDNEGSTEEPTRIGCISVQVYRGVHPHTRQQEGRSIPNDEANGHRYQLLSDGKRTTPCAGGIGDGRREIEQATIRKTRRELEKYRHSGHDEARALKESAPDVADESNAQRSQSRRDIGASAILEQNRTGSPVITQNRRKNGISKN